MKWTGRGDRSAVGCEGSLYTVRADGTLEVRGDSWKECPLEMQAGFCRRKGVKEVGGPACKGCLRSPVIGGQGSRENAMSLAEEIDGIFKKEMA